MFYTSYFANIKNLPKDAIVISICGKAPDGYKGRQYKKLAPKWDFFKVWKETQDNEYYVECFKKQVLGNLSLKEVFDDLFGVLSESYYTFEEDIPMDIVFVCYETPDKFCHRHIIAEWFEENGFLCKEWRK